jgi:drug/metabolite transporter (DMT)-like permease
MWLFYALVGPPFWALVHILDGHCVGNVFDRSWMGVITSSLATAAIFIVALLVFPFSGYALQLPDIKFILLAMLAGGLIQLGQSFYFNALEKTEAGIVAAYGNFTPTLLPIASYVLLGDVLEPWHYLSIGVLVVASICFCLIDISRSGKCDSVFLMLIASTLQVSAILIEKYVFENGDFLVCFGFIIIGVILSGVLPVLISSGVRKAFVKNVPKLKPLALVFLAIEMANLIALYMSQKAIDLGSPTLSAAMETTVPGYTFLLTMLLIALKHRFGNKEASYKIGTKLLLVGIMTVGVVQIA